MRTIPEKIQNDLTGSSVSFDYLLKISSEPDIFISTTKQMFDSGAEIFGGDLLSESANSVWTLSSSDGTPEDDVIIEDGLIKFLGIGGSYSQAFIPDLLELGVEYKVTVTVVSNSGGSILVNDGNPYISIVPAGETGTFEATWIPENSLRELWRNY